jgi:glycosyltransferase involved in cell wall biosynthesis
MLKKCLSCGAQFTLSGSGKRQKYCQECSRRGDGRVRGLPASNPLKIKGAKSDFQTPIPRAYLGRFIREQILVQKDQPNPISFIIPEGINCLVWLGTDDNGKLKLGDDRHWRLGIEELVRQEEKKRPVTRWNPTSDALRRPIIVVGRNDPIKNMDDALGVLKGFRVRICIDAEKELQVLGCGWRIVTCQFRGKKVLLHHGGNTATMKRDAFKAFLVANKRARGKRPLLRLVVSNPPRDTTREAAA